MSPRTLILRSHSGEVVVEIGKDAKPRLDVLASEIEYDEMLTAMSGQKSELVSFLQLWASHEEIDALTYMCPTVRSVLRFTVECIERAWALVPHKELGDDEDDLTDFNINFSIRVAREYISDAKWERAKYAEREIDQFSLSHLIDSSTLREMIAICQMVLAIEARVGSHEALDKPIGGSSPTVNSILGLCAVVVANRRVKLDCVKVSVEDSGEYWDWRNAESRWQILRFVDVVHALQLGLPWPETEDAA